MVQKIALFNQKGGVSKTTTTFNLGWMLATKGKRVILVDADPQCNLTEMVLGSSTKQELDEIYKKEQNIKSGLAPAFESRPKLIQAIDCLRVEGCEGLFLLPGHVGFAEYEITLGMAQELSGSIQALQNLPGSISYLLLKTANKFNADYILIDMSPGLSSINQNLLMTNDFFILPTSPDFFSLMAIDSLVTILPKLCAWAKKASELRLLQESTYPFPKVIPRFLGTVVQNYRIAKEPAPTFQKWIDAIQEAVSARLVPSLQENRMLLTDEMYASQGIEHDYCLAKISNFNSLIAKSQENKTPVFDLTPDQIGQQGIILNNTLKAQEKFKTTFDELADKVIGLTANAVSN
ncbi:MULTISPECIES: AAA family ATPase [unclassified Microcoleus]|uniref:AAA family ATPase n=1 Tax=unclassified Microcoleus TaxID=2642155 RepID=UPI002FD1221C